VVVTGLGAVTPLGGDVASTWSALLNGTSGVRRLNGGWPDSLPVRIAAPAAAAAAAAHPAEGETAQADRWEQLALIAARQAWQDAGQPRPDPERLGISVSSSIGGLGRTVLAHDTLDGQGADRLSPATAGMIMTNGAAGLIGIEFGARAGVHAPVSACASGTEAIGYGMQMIRAGRADVVLAGGAEACIIPLTVALFTQIRALSYRNDEPERASRPFDKGRDGFVLGEGAGILVLESAEHAARRGAVVHAFAAGVGYSSDAYNLTQPDPEGTGPALAIERALADAGLAPDQVTHINAHATSTPAGDGAEAMAIRRAMGDAAGRAVVSATKSMTGHLLGGAGAVESIAAICALRDGVAPPTINLEDPDDAITATGIDVAPVPRELRARTAALNNSFGFGGHNVTLAFTAS
jgi:3-oxoacyl-[acyl-carrier-protein] synthase II